MARLSVFQKFLEAFQIQAKQPASEAELTRAEAQLGFALPASLRSCLLICDGGRAVDGPSSLRLLSLKEALEYRAFLPKSSLGYFPFSENNDSNPLCICCQSPLANYVVQVCHDDAPELKYRSLDGFFRAALAYLDDTGDEDVDEDEGEEKYLDTHALLSDFVGPERSKPELALARDLIERAAQGEFDEFDERTNILRFACDLLPDAEIDAIARLLDHGDQYLREHVIGRLKRLPDPRAKKALKEYEKKFDAFVERCGEILTREGIQAFVVPMHGNKTIRLEPGPVWLAMDVFFESGTGPDGERFLLERAKALLANRRKNKKIEARY